MLDGLLKSKFYSRCKSEMKLMMKRIEIIRRKRNAMHKFLRNDVADLIRTALESNAFDRVGQLYIDQNLSSCYEFIEESCLLVLSQLSVMNKQRECLEECKEPLSTIMFAAARFADLPELRELRRLFRERYGNNLEPYVNQQFVKNLKADPPTTRIKIQMLHEIAMEYSISWDLEHLEHKLSKSMAEIETRKEELDHGSLSPCRSSNTSISSESITSADDSASEDTYKKSTKTSTETYDGLLRSMGPPYTKPNNIKTEDDITKAVPRSMRVRRPLERAAGSSKGENEVVKTSYDVSSDENNIRDEGENKMDKLLSHYSKKGSHVPAAAPKRSGSLPCERVAGGGGDDGKGLSRAVTFQADSRGHVHPKLPDYDDFVARLAAFRASS
ncbi:uncharacterized protein LOC143625636 [Bidens hawaiensis]|uniref:uncharacterized protein LOC143625636 n=1 Tax=Bidens hawaiensis TaxID=980011 RepID=UPI00404B7B89